MALGTAPQLRLAVFGKTGHGSMGLDIALMHRRGLEAALDNQIGLGKTGLDIANRDIDFLENIGSLGRLRRHAVGEHIGMQNRCIRLHRLFDIDHMRQHLVIDLDQFERGVGDGGTGCGHGGDGVAVIKRFAVGHDVVREIAEIELQLARRHPFGFQFRDIGGGDHRLHAGQRLGLRGVDGFNNGVGVRAPENLAGQHAGQHQIGAELGPAGNLVIAVRADRAGADPFIVFGLNRHDQAPLISAAQSMTARIILS